MRRSGTATTEARFRPTFAQFTVSMAEGGKAQTSTTPNLARSRPPPNTDTGSSSSGVPRTDTVRQQNSVAGGQPQNPVAPGPSRDPPRGQQGVVERQPLQPPTEFRVLQLPPPQEQFLPPRFLFQYSFGTLNNYCGTVISKMNMDYHHEYLYDMRDEYNIDSPSVLDVYAKAVRVLDYMTFVVRKFGAAWQDMVKIAEALIEAMKELVQMLGREEIRQVLTRDVLLIDMVDFLVNPLNRGYLTTFKGLIENLHYAICRIANHAMAQGHR